MENEIKTAIIPIAGLGTRFLPLSKVLSKEFFPLADLPILQYILKEAMDSGLKEVIFVNRKDKKNVLDYFKRDQNLINILKARKRESLLEEMEGLEQISREIKFSQVFQAKPLGDGHALLQAKNKVKGPCAVAFADDIVESEVPCFLQLMEVYKKYGKPVIGLTRVPKESFSSYGMVQHLKIDEKTYKLTGIIEKPKIEESPSDLAIVGRYILTPEVFEWLKDAKVNEKGEIVMADIFAKKIKEGEEILGHEFSGKWLECGNKLAYLKTNFYLSLKKSKFREDLKKFLKEEKLA